MKTTTKIIKVKPVEIDASFKYQCTKCQHEHWVELREVSYKGFVIVCLCGNIIKPKTVSRVKVLYSKHRKNNIHKTQKQTLDRAIINTACKTLSQYGFTEQEVLGVIQRNNLDSKSYNDPVSLVKDVVKFFGEYQHG
jgi:hypothetical protein